MDNLQKLYCRYLKKHMNGYSEKGSRKLAQQKWNASPVPIEDSRSYGFHEDFEKQLGI